MDSRFQTIPALEMGRRTWAPVGRAIIPLVIVLVLFPGFSLDLRRAMTSWTQQPIHFLDFEGSRASGILEYGVVTIERGLIVSVGSRLCRGTGVIPPADSEVHGITARDVETAPLFAADWAYFAGLRETGPFAAHFAGVENGLLRSVWPYPRPSPDFARPGEQVTDWGPWIDSAQLYRQCYPTLSGSGLERLVADCRLQGELDGLAAKHCPPQRRRYHTAPYDALAGALLLLSLAREPQMARLTLTQLLALSTLAPARRDSILQRELF